MPDALENTFQQDIVNALVAGGWRLGTSAGYDREHALYPEDVVGFMSEAQPDQWAKFCKMYPENPEASMLRSLARALDDKGTLQILRKHYTDRGARIHMCRFKPDHGLNEETERQYGCNRLRVVPELVYSPHGYVGRLDLALFVNGIPVATLELKSEFKQSVHNAIRQYKKDRPPKDPHTRKGEPLLTFKRGALVHFAVSQEDVYMCTRLAGDASRFLPFNKGTDDGGAGNPPPTDPDDYATGYLWQEVLRPDNFLRILGRFLHLEVKETTDWQGRTRKKETMIFPRFHQWDAVNRLIDTARAEGPGHKYLIQHSAGSGKSNSIAWTAHQLSSLHDAEDGKVFDSVIVITDRTVLDNQLQETIYQFDHRRGAVTRVSREYGDGSKSEQLAGALEEAAGIVIVTIQTFPYVLKLLQERTALKGRTYAVIADEAHSSQTGGTAQKLREVLNLEQLDQGADLSSEDVLQATLASRRDSDRISYFAFTATPKPKTLELFGRRPRPDLPASAENIPQSFHVYTMRQAIEEGYILDVLRNYTTYSMAYKLAHTNPEDEREVDARKGASTIAKWVRHHPHNIATKVEVIIEHFRTRIAARLNGQAKAMVVTSSRLAAVRYKLAFDKYIGEHPQCQGIQAMVAFSGDVEDAENGTGPFNETNMNPTLKKRDMRKAFDTDEYQVMIVANKFQTGFDQPKLCAMYVDKKLAGVDCVQTLSRLNRTYPGKDQTFVLDFANKPEDILAAFQPYYKVARLQDVSDPNLVYELKDKLDGQDIYRWEEVEAFVEAFFNDKASQARLMRHCRPARERFGIRYKEVLSVVRDAEEAFREAKKTGNEIVIKNARISVSEARKGKDVLDIFKRDLKRFTRFYEFASQIIDFDDQELEKLSIYARHLLPLLREERLDDEIDLSDIEMTHYRLAKKREEQIKLENEDGTLRPPSDETASAKERETERLAEIVERMNRLFDGEFTGGDALSYARTIVTKLRENDRLMTELRVNSPAQAMLGSFPQAVEDAVIESMDTHAELARQFLGRERTRKGFAKLVMDLILKGFGDRAPEEREFIKRLP
ncbi:type I restriction endonuclease subunit R [Pseudodesulfovibrio pelocollis]|uniref:type I restriction endonuclease subunit R n=1 Tax=Pseudodesulfovibrio pelocollis TaxID=3051432 RepID=UPI00255AB9A6|nr:type I restriction endonuclease [Pseudodesulfovibrio sp. SB368]